ncbi:MAG: hypothetical protein P1U87_02305 [Verrucomicrobiales bacterium]|nr:hypothetical protein [Verrucomicrobiales bacterium]
MTDLKRRRLRLVLTIAFALAIVMGPGPGIYFINPGSDETTPRLLLGMPIVYAWAAFWFGVQAIVVLLSYLFLWRDSKS